MSNHRISHIELDEATIIWRNADVEQERRVAIFDLIEENSFRPVRASESGLEGALAAGAVPAVADHGFAARSTSGLSGTPDSC